MFGPIRTVVFDLDGTLVDTMPSVVRGLKQAVETHHGREVTEKELVATFGPAPLDVLRRWLPGEKAQAAYAQWLDFEKSLTPGDMAVFPGVPEMLAGLEQAGIRTLVFTGRDRGGTIRILKHHAWLGRHFSEDAIRCGDDGYPTKPSPEGLTSLLKQTGIDPAVTLMVGDLPADMHAGRGAGTKTGAALWDLPPGQGTDRSRFRAAWVKWDGQPVDVRLIEPGSLLSWLSG